ncbi:hypothetical protein [Frankia sp. CiP3]|uniref:hypothetical protein n=1 Tax=Frankia sp. CiP3 TaxID=2880971 RepID=UPI001EF5EAB9|nr:hypothetical protein [Frankia sp. CiP3]
MSGDQLCMWCFTTVYEGEAVITPGGWIFHPGCEHLVSVHPPVRHPSQPDPRVVDLLLAALTGPTVRHMVGRGWSLSECRAAATCVGDLRRWQAWTRLQIFLMARALETGRHAELAERLRMLAAEVTP